MPRPPSDAPIRILQASAEILRTSGPSALSFDRIAAVTGLSKGGVLHYFRTREALVAALVERLVHELGAAVDDAVAADEETLGAYRRAWVDTMLRAAERRDGVVVLAALVVDPGLNQPFWSFLADSRRRIASEVGPIEATVLTGAVEARWWAAVLGGPNLDRTTAMQLRDRLLRAG